MIKKQSEKLGDTFICVTGLADISLEGGVLKE